MEEFQSLTIQEKFTFVLKWMKSMEKMRKQDTDIHN